MEHTSISPNDVVLAIETRSAEVVRQYLKQGGDANASTGWLGPMKIGHWNISAKNPSGHDGFRFLHVAVIDCLRTPQAPAAIWSLKMNVIYSLIRGGAKRDLTATLLFENRDKRQREHKTLTPLALALTLKKGART